MIKNTDLFFTRATEYQNKRMKIIDEYEARIKGLETAKGSKFFDDESKKAESKKDEALRELKNEYSEHFRICLDAMAAANAARKMTPPTEEALRILQLLKMKEKPTETELTAAANSLKDNATALSILTQLAHKAGYMQGYDHYSTAKEVSVSSVEETIRGLRASVRDFLDFDTPRAARLAKEYHETMYGSSANAAGLPKRRTFATKAQCFDIVAQMGGDMLEAFASAVDGE